MVCASVYAHFYTWWALFNYLNDDFFEQLPHQTVFSVTEIVVSVHAIGMLDRRRKLVPKKLLVIARSAIMLVLLMASLT